MPGGKSVIQKKTKDNSFKKYIVFYLILFLLWYRACRPGKIKPTKKDIIKYINKTFYRHGNIYEPTKP